MMQQTARAIAFDGLAGFLHFPALPLAAPVPDTDQTSDGYPVPAAEITGAVRRGVVMLPPWGFDDLLVRQGWGMLAAAIAQTGIPCLRFDWPGTGDSLGEDRNIQDLAPLRAAVQSAADFLRAHGGVEELILLGQGLGALMAQDRADTVCASGLILMAPMPDGRAGMREQAITGAMINGFLRFVPEESTGLNNAGFVMSQKLIGAFRDLHPAQAPLHSVRQVLVLARQDRAADRILADNLRARGITVTQNDYEGYSDFATVTMRPCVPLADFAKICTWLGMQEVPSVPPAALPVALPDKVILTGGHFQEEPLRFGPNGRLFGILTTPRFGPPRAIAVILSAGYNPHIGWARAHVQMARILAGQGIAVLRMDCGGLGESAADPAATGDVLYHDCQIADAGFALDALSARYSVPLLLIGRCSGAYNALHVAERDLRVKGLVCINALRLIWRPDETLEQAMASGSSSLADYRRRIFSPDFIRQFVLQTLSSRYPVRHFLQNVRRLALRIRLRTASALAPYAGTMTQSARLTRQVRARFDLFSRHGVEVRLIYADNDAGLDELTSYCGPQGRALAGQSNLRIKIVADADHNMTAGHARTAIVTDVLDLVSTLEKQTSVLGKTKQKQYFEPSAA